MLTREITKRSNATNAQPGFQSRYASLSARDMQTPTLFQALGGMPGVLQLAHAWHERVLSDEVVSHAFSHGFHPHHTERLAAYWGEAWGGPPMYSEQYGTESSVVRMHSGNGVHEEMDQRAIDCFVGALQDADITNATLARALTEYFVWTTKGAMAAYPHSANEVPDGLHIARWSWNGLQHHERIS